MKTLLLLALICLFVACLSLSTPMTLAGLGIGGFALAVVVSIVGIANGLWRLLDWIAGDVD